VFSRQFFARSDYVSGPASECLCSKCDIRRYDCSSLVRSHAYLVLFKLCIMRYVYPASLYLLSLRWSASFVCTDWLLFRSYSNGPWESYSIFVLWHEYYFNLKIHHRCSERISMCFIFKKNIRNNFVWYCTWIHRMFLAVYDYNIDMCAYHYILFNWVSKHISSFLHFIFRAGTKRYV